MENSWVGYCGNIELFVRVSNSLSQKLALLVLSMSVFQKIEKQKIGSDLTFRPRETKLVPN